MTFQGTTRQTVQLVKSNPFMSVSVGSLLGVGAFLVSQGWNPLDTIVKNSGSYQDLQAEVAELTKTVYHAPHVLQTQNFILKTLLDNEVVTVEQYTMYYHQVVHDDSDGDAL